tara:strand:+ start:1071 stop:1481 length:411 start_codon:yes stop_codon:yes gene_type:complete
MLDVTPIIELYKHFDVYEKNTNLEIFHHILQSVNVEQYKVFKKNNEVIGFCSWAFLNKKEEEHLLKTSHIRAGKWNSGNIIWQMDIVAKKNARDIALQTRKHITNLVGVGKTVKWKRGYKSEILYKQFKTKRHYLK